MSKQLIIAYFILGTTMIAGAVALALTAALTPEYSLYVAAGLLLLFGVGLTIMPAEKRNKDAQHPSKNFIEK